MHFEAKEIRLGNIRKCMELIESLDELTPMLLNQNIPLLKFGEFQKPISSQATISS